MFNMLTGYEPFVGKTPSQLKDSIRFNKINFELIKNQELRELDKKLLNRFVQKRISAKEALEEINKIKNNNIPEEENEEDNNIENNNNSKSEKSFIVNNREHVLVF